MINGKRPARETAYEAVEGGVVESGGIGNSGVRTRAYTIVVKAAVHCMRRDGVERSRGQSVHTRDEARRRVRQM
eukprot:4390951-Prorocentrum_lima.AAC.1